MIQVLVLEPLESEVLRLRDEVDILRPAEAKLSKVEQNLSRWASIVQIFSTAVTQLMHDALT